MPLITLMTSSPGNPQ
ncbi:hypothetical protein EK904_003720 [Melospiza melodia maxima]|nr:hypothetical protein EK904_003720 [Melospiza melodia maxima]